MATFATSDQLLVIIDPAARHRDGESVRIAKDVLSAGATTKVCLPDGPEEFARALGRRGSRRPVVVGDDRALIRAVTLLHRHRELAGCALSMVPVGEAALAESLGVPAGAVAAARAVLDGPERRRVEVDGDTVVDLDQPVEAVSVTPGAHGIAEVEVRPLSLGAEATPLRASGRSVTVVGADFRYRADAAVAGPVRRRTWTVREDAWSLTLPAPE
ncbi:diacylglycerol kinase [Streptomyces sp. IBSBF 3136]|uniref:diacylglycerol kinase n=1 Tax=Streptomyces sp. IBSBF 3136 TaxID=2903524 RepID=UPI002FDBF838